MPKQYKQGAGHYLGLEDSMFKLLLRTCATDGKTKYINYNYEFISTKDVCPICLEPVATMGVVPNHVE